MRPSIRALLFATPLLAMFGAPVQASVPPVDCSTLRLTPANGALVPFTNTQVTFAYGSERADLCGDITLVDAGGKPVPTTQVYRSEWSKPSAGVAGAITIEPLENLAPGETYRVMAAGTVLGSFRVAYAPLSRGAAIQVTDQAVKLAGLPQSALIPVDAINDLLRTYLRGVVHDAGLVETAYNVLSKETPNLARPLARYNARVKKIFYTTSSATGSLIALGGLLVYPENPDGSPFDFSKAGMVLGEHGSAKSKNPALSSAATPDLLVGLLAAGKGQVFFAPDLIGFGNTATLPQAYLMTQDTATASQDLLLAVRGYINRTFPATPLGRDLRIVGGSQGGFSSVAVIPYLSRLADIKGVFAGEGPYNLEQTLTSSLQAVAGQPRDRYSEHEDLRFVPGHLQALLDSYRAYQRFSFNQGDIFTGEDLNPTFVQNFVAGQYPLIQKHFGLNSLVNNKVVYNAPAAKVVLFHYSKDSLVPAQNTEDMLAYLNNGTHTLASASRGDCKENSWFSRLFVSFSHSKEKTHLVCAVYLLDQAVSEF